MLLGARSIKVSIVCSQVNLKKTIPRMQGALHAARERKAEMSEREKRKVKGFKNKMAIANFHTRSGEKGRGGMKDNIAIIIIQRRGGKRMSKRRKRDMLKRDFAGKRRSSVSSVSSRPHMKMPEVFQQEGVLNKSPVGGGAIMPVHATIQTAEQWESILIMPIRTMADKSSTVEKISINIDLNLNA